MSVKSLRLPRHWSQEQLAQLSNLNVRTIQRVEKGEGAGLETLKSLASVFEISVDELKAVIERGNQPRSEDVFNSENSKAMHERAKAKVTTIKYFYAFTAFLGAVDLCCTLLQQSVCHLDKATVCRSSGLNQKQSTQYK
ncbi:hypothetical protein C6Y40_20845 [Alteromonas alba]|uniref:HTH cro/C1-type domain-containing protein n=1 Tax=Alteromonas alba TaxID=2079529 RepID=A0A2S9V599_9ALTE|nr:helix-turn-helix transcriptional regulator [Alteromonas alba]PRO71647.1 hypothetical protein C6Y40_20845 [Alteromonas alba]